MPADVIAPRAVYTQQTNTELHVVNFNDANIGTFRHLGTIPVNAFILSAKAYVVTPFNAGTSNAVTIGTTYANANELFAAGDITPGTVGYYDSSTTKRGLGLALTQAASPPELQPNTTNTYVDTCEGGVGLYAKFTQTGTAATAGQLYVIIEYAFRSGTA